MNIQGLISEDATDIINKLLEDARLEGKLMQEQLDQVLKVKGREIFASMEEHLAEIIVSKYEISEFHKQQEIVKSNHQKIVNKHEDLFHYFFAYVHTVHIVYTRFLEKVGDSAIVEAKISTHLLLYGNLCRMADQIGLMLAHGFPDGALRLWRSFYEHAVVAAFLLQQNSDDLDTRFRKATARDRFRSVESFSKHHVELKFPALSSTLIKKVEEEYIQIKDDLGNDFFDNEYSWAKPFLVGKPNFRSLEDAAGFSRYRPFYIWACGKSHPNFKEISDFKDSKGNTVLSWVVRQNNDRRSMVDPGQLTLAVFHQVNDCFLHLYAGHEYDINLQIFRKLYERFGDTLAEDKMDVSTEGS